MKQIILLFSILFNLITFAQQRNIVGTWLLTHVEKNNKSVDAYIITQFKSNGKMSIQNFDIAQWQLSNNKLIITSEYQKKLEGEAIVEKLNQHELIYNKSGEKYYFIAYNPEQIKRNRLFNLLKGVWKTNGKETSYIYFDNDNQFIQLVVLDDGTMTTKGQWLFLPNSNNIFIQGDIEGLRGENHILNVDQKSLKLKHNETDFQFEKVLKISSPQYLSFNYDEIENNQSDPYDLPWSDEALFGFLPDIQSLTYIYKSYEKDLGVFITRQYLYDIDVNQKDKEIKFSLYKVDNQEKKHKIKETIKGFLQNNYNRFFPQTDIAPFRIINNFEQITVNDKKYDCTVVEGFDGENKIKYWMINDKPGIYAKIIKQNDDISTYIIYQWSGQ